MLPAETADAPARWIPVSPAQQRLLDERMLTPLREPWALQLQAETDFVAMPLTGPPQVPDAP
jgi:hypothetical protein